jgi:uncharacterized protein (TIGR03437 family)
MSLVQNRRSISVDQVHESDRQREHCVGLKDFTIRYARHCGAGRVISTQLLVLVATASLHADIRRDVFPSIDLVNYVTNGQPEYDWIVRPGGDSSSIRMRFSIADGLKLDRAGNLIINAGPLEILHTRPFIYQDVAGGRRVIDGRFTLIDPRTAGFEIGRYDHDQPLVIDPRVVVGASFGGHGSNFGGLFTPTRPLYDFGAQLAFDAAGNIYVAGHTASLDFPLVNPLTPASPTCGESANCAVSGSFVAKLDPTGSQLLYSTFVGDLSLAPAVGYTPPEWVLFSPPIAVAVDAMGNAYVTGGIGALAMKLDPSGKLAWSQKMGGGDTSGIVGASIAVEPSGRVVITGTTQTANLPVTSNAYRATTDVPNNIFLMELDTKSGSITYCTYLGPSFAIPGSMPYPQVTVTNDGGVVVATTTNSADWPTTPGVVQPAYSRSDAAPYDSVMILKLDTASSRLVWATYLGGNRGTEVSGIASGPGGDIYLTGTTSNDFPFTAGAARAEGCQSFLARLNSSATSLVYAACAGGNRVAVDSAGDAFATGPPSDIRAVRAIQGSPIWALCPVYGTSTPTSRTQIVGYQECPSAGTLTALSPSGDNILWSTYLGSGTANGLAVDSDGNVAVTGDYLLPGSKPIAGNSSVSVVKIAPDGEPPQLTLANAVSFVPGLPAPGGLATLFATGLNDIDGLTVASGAPPPIELAGVRVLVGGVPAPILAVAGKAGESQQINFQVPFEATTSLVELQYEGTSIFTSGPLVGPGIFTLADGTPAVQHAADYSLVTQANPITDGETIVIYATGFGRLFSSPTGAILFGGYPSVKIGQGSCKVLYAGEAPGFIGGYQVNCQVDGVESGEQPLQIAFTPIFLLRLPSSATQSNIVTIPVR